MNDFGVLCQMNERNERTLSIFSLVRPFTPRLSLSLFLCFSYSRSVLCILSRVKSHILDNSKVFHVNVDSMACIYTHDEILSLLGTVRVCASPRALNILLNYMRILKQTPFCYRIID